ncbi:hypothetical protein CVD28_10010 [Bacillus sp. M6-12]|uniref:YczE/YyaS/YitT family protein n=1 Tax=Bacillus sp. M6-12 TaxID=2054166 RepID=UPI000C78A798|nr:YitT family protein [Bacillus sp. M6-12]PLS18009.1 hypothetical protein CVD28_10010 [Bacillus sp. M6-12]
MRQYIRIILFFVGLMIFALGAAITVKVKHLGLHPWDVLNVGLYERFGLTIGSWSVLCGLFLLTVSWKKARQYISIGTFLNAALIGPFMDFYLWLDLLPSATHTWVDYLIILSGIVLTGIGGGMYVAAGLGAGPRDGFMLSISDTTGLSVSKARILVESFVLLIGFLIGGPVFIVSFIYTFIQSPIFQRSLSFFKQVIAVPKMPENQLQKKAL